MRVFPADLAFDSLRNALEDLRVQLSNQQKVLGKRSPLEKPGSLPLEEIGQSETSIILALFGVTLASKVHQKNKIFLSELLIILNLVLHGLKEKGKMFLLRRSTQEKIDLEDESNASRPVTPVLVMANLFVTELFPSYLSRITW